MADVTFDSIVKNELELRAKKYQEDMDAANAALAQASKDFAVWYREAIASPEYARLEKASEKILEKINEAAAVELQKEMDKVEERFKAEWQKASDEFDAMYEKNPEKAIKRAMWAVDYLEYEYTKQNLKVAEMVVDFYIELAEFQVQYLRWLKKFCKNPERQIKIASWEVESFMKKAQRTYDQVQDELKKASYSQDSDEAEFAQALRAFLDKYVA